MPRMTLAAGPHPARFALAYSRCSQCGRCYWDEPEPAWPLTCRPCKARRRRVSELLCISAAWPWGRAWREPDNPGQEPRRRTAVALTTASRGPADLLIATGEVARWLTTR